MIILLAINSCGSKDDHSITLKVKPELGNLGNYLTIENPEAVINLHEITYDEEPGIKLMSTLQITITEDVTSDRSFCLEAEILDKNMNKISDFPEYDIDSQHDYSKEYSNFLNSGNYRAVMEVTSTKAKWEEEAAIWERIQKEGVYIALKPRSYSKFESYNSSKEDSVKDDENIVVLDDVDAIVVEPDLTHGEDWDAIIDEYEGYCDKIVPLAKKAKAGDISALTECASLVETAEALQKKLENAESELTTGQTLRLTKIMTKMSKAVMDME